ncbi:MAG: tripartite tricarboxylate transporter TctB family protein [Candidatus Rokubacteria bacterium]|nr:tripartite tricarboxylate transporter TctB family protein [Candidatus Rokubacteria bacterium]
MVERGLLLLILAVAAFYLSEAIRLPLGATARPGAGWYPTAVAVFACIVALIAAVQAFRAPVVRRVRDTGGDAPARRRRVLATVMALVAFCFVLPSIGYPIAALAFTVAMLIGLGSRWPVAMGTGVAAALGSYYLFAVLLDVPLPRGPW